MDYYRDIVTEKSWQMLQTIRQQYSFVLIGGWAVWLYTRRFKSKDIDIIVETRTLTKLKTQFPVTKNNRLFKYEAVGGEIQIDIYVPFWSHLGIPAEDVQSQAIALEGFHVPLPETLVVLKQTAYQARTGSSKGYKDFLDIISLISLPQFRWNYYRSHAPQQLAEQLMTTLSHTTSIPELSLNRHQFAKMKKAWLRTLAP
jgi:hypothetical protein